MSLNDDQFHVVKSVRQQPTVGRNDGVGVYTGNHQAEFVLVDPGYNGSGANPVGRVTYNAQNGWTTPSNYDAEFDVAKVGDTPPMFRKDSYGYVGNMAVDPDWQGHGLGKELAHRVLEHHWEQNPEQFGSMPDHSSLSTASGGMIEHLVPGRGTDPGEGWDTTEFYPEEHGIHREDYGFDEEDEDAYWDEYGYDAAVDDAREMAADGQRERFAEDQMREAYDSADAVNEYQGENPDTTFKPGTVLHDDGWTYSIAHPPKYSQEQAQHIVNHGAPEPEAPEAQQPRPFRNGQMRLPGTYQRRLP